MKTIILLTYFFSSSILAQHETDKERDIAFYKATKDWFSAWELLSKDIYGIDTVKPVNFVLFDDKYVYSTSATTISDGNNVSGNNLMNISLEWRKQLHNDTIQLPDKSIVPIGIMSFAKEVPDSDESFFVMPLPEFWKQTGLKSEELGVDNLITGVFLHEFSHTQQMQNFGKEISRFEQRNTYNQDMSDDMIQMIFAENKDYVEIYLEEVGTFYDAFNKKTANSSLIKKGLDLMNQRQDKFFRKEHEGLSELDNFFLTMEGFGQYSMYQWLTHPKGGNIDQDLAIKGVRRGKKWWSQEEGFVLFLLLDKLSKPKNWAQTMFGDETITVVDLIKQKLYPN